MTRTRLRKVVAVVLTAVVAVAALLLLAPVQTALVRTVAGGIDGVDISVDRVWVGPWGADVDGLSIRAPAVELEIDSVDADLAFWSSIGHLSLDVEDVSATEVNLRLGPFSGGDDEASEPFEFRGLAPVAWLPKRLIVRQAEAEGAVTILLARGLSIEGSWTATASDMARDRRLRATVEAVLETRRGDEGVLAAVIGASVEAEADSEASLRTIVIDAGIRSLEDDPDGVDANLVLDVADEAESYVVTVDGSVGHRLLDVEAQFEPEAKMLHATWEATTTEGLVAAFAVGDARPDLWGHSTGTAVVDLRNRRLEINALARVETREWGKLDPRLAEVTELVMDLDLAGSAQGRRFDAQRFNVAMTSVGGRNILRLETMMPLSVDLETMLVTPEIWGEPAFRVEMDQFPLNWIRTLDRSLVTEDGAVSAVLDVVPLGTRHVTVVAHDPITARGLQLSAGDLGARPSPLDVTIVPRLMFKEGELTAEISSFEMTAPTGLRVNFTGGASTSDERWPVIDLEGVVAMRLPRLQAALESLDAVRGRARFALDLGSKTLDLDSAALGAADVENRPLVKVTLENETPLNIALPSMVADWEKSKTQEFNILFNGLPIAWVSPFIPELEFEGGALYGELEAVAGGGRGVSLSPVEPFQVRGLRPLYRGILVAEDSTVSLAPHLRLDNTEARLALDDISVRTPDGGRLDGQMTFRAPRDGRRRITTEFRFEGDFPAITGRIGQLGALSWRQRAIVDVPSRRVEVNELELGLTDRAGTRFLELEAVRPFDLTTEPFGIWVDGGSPDILVVTVTPLELQRLFPRVFGFQLEGVLPQGQFVGRAENGGLVLVAEEELVFQDVSVRWEEAALLDRVTVGMSYEVVYSTDGLTARSIDFSILGPRGTPIAEATLRAVMPLTDRTTIESLHFESVGNLEPLTRQPVLEGLPDFVEGTIGGSLDMTFGEDSSIRGDLHLRGARAENEGTFPDADAELDFRAVGDTKFTVRVPLQLRSGNGVSDLSFEGGVERSGEDFLFEAELTGDRIVAEDVIQLVHVVSPPDPNASLEDYREPAETAFRERWSKTAIAQLREKRDSEPFWGGDVSGEAGLDLGSVQFPRYVMDGVRGLLRVDPGAVTVEAVEAGLLGARLTAEGSLTYDGTAEAPYELDFSSSFVDLDLGRLFRAVEPDAPPTLEGIFEVHTKAYGEGRNPADLGLGTLGEVRVRGRDGVFRGLAGQYTLARRGTQVLGVITFSKQLKAVSRLLGQLEALEFESFEAALARETPRRFAISELTVVSPLARIEGTGGVEVEAGVPLAASPLDASFDMATSGDMTILFYGLGLLQDDTDEYGYRPVIRPVAVGGTVAEPDTSEFYQMLDEAATDSKGILGVGMRRANKQLRKAEKAKKP